LATGIHGKGAHKAICHTAKQNFVKPFGYKKTTFPKWPAVWQQIRLNLPSDQVFYALCGA